jgi:predicted short-subunit dehydrogenase-like oxidoreductase (DUF2520 family)
VKSGIQKISLVGLGNVGYHLAKAFDKTGIEITHVFSRQLKSCPELSFNPKFIDNLKDLPNSQLIILCVPDDVIKDTLELIHPSCPVAYTSGSTDISSLPERENIGVLYPLQTFSKDTALNMNEVPFFIEGSNSNFSATLFDLAWEISSHVNYANSQERKELHLAAIWVNNFTNHLIHIAKEYLESKELDFGHLKPLLLETVMKLKEQEPYDSQTGPARRGDVKIIEQHLSKLEGTSKEIYQLISDSIINTYLPK